MNSEYEIQKVWDIDQNESAKQVFHLASDHYSPLQEKSLRAGPHLILPYYVSLCWSVFLVHRTSLN